VELGPGQFTDVAAAVECRLERRWWYELGRIGFVNAPPELAKALESRAVAGLREAERRHSRRMRRQRTQSRRTRGVPWTNVRRLAIIFGWQFQRANLKLQTTALVGENPMEDCGSWDSRNRTTGVVPTL